MPISSEQLIKETEEKLHRSLDTKEKEFIKWMVEEENYYSRTTQENKNDRII
ncbi:hypothetical protein [Alteribacillus sp. HJP-4]|uniref:hypothetical protein n=1 Tax=Alteribacillus sp. HJP-4 TaxID=2775394 RepID=UPI0035CCFE20